MGDRIKALKIDIYEKQMAFAVKTSILEAFTATPPLYVIDDSSAAGCSALDLGQGMFAAVIPETLLENGRLAQRVQLCNLYFCCDLCAYISHAVEAHEIYDAVAALMRMGGENPGRVNEVFTEDERPEGSGAALMLRRVVSYIQEHLDEPLRCEDIAGFAHFNPDYLTRVFKRETSLTLSQYIYRRRMEKAANLLLTTDLSVGDIAAKIGYTNLAQFSPRGSRPTPRKAPPDTARPRRSKAYPQYSRIIVSEK